MNVTKLKDDVIDSGIEESSTTSEVRKGSASKETTFGVKVKQERQTSDDSSDDSYTAPPPTTKKRKLSFGNDSTISSQAKRIKSEPVDSETSSRSSKSSQSKSSSDKKELASQSSEKPSSKDKEKTKKRKSRVIADIDEFEASIQKLLSSTQIKKEK